MIQSQRSLKKILVTGGAGFIGSTLVRHLLKEDEVEKIVVLDKLTYAGRRENLNGPDLDPRFEFVQGDITDGTLLEELINDSSFTGIFHLAAESHVDRSIASAAPFIQTNIIGTATLLEIAAQLAVPLLHCSTDEVYGSVDPPDKFTEESPLNPSSPYSASKAAADLLCLAHFKTFQTNIVITRSSNNYGPRQHSEKLIPHFIECALNDRPMGLYGDGLNIRDWIHVDDHCQGMITAFLKSKPGRVYNFGGHCERTNIGIARSILKILGKPESLIAMIEDRLGHDRRYAIDTTKSQSYFGWQPTKSFTQEFPDIVRSYAADFS